MVIEMHLGLGTATEKKLYRNVLPHQLSTYREGFLANRNYYQWGELWSLRGTDRTLVHRFGIKPQGTKNYKKPHATPVDVDDFDYSDEWKERERRD